MSGSKVGLIIASTGGLAFVLVNAGTLGGPVAVVLQVLGVLAYLGLLVVLFRTRTMPGAASGDPVRFTPVYWAITAAEVLAFFGGNLLLNLVFGLPQAVLAWVTFVVGVHFIPLGRLWTSRGLVLVGSALAVCGLVGLLIAVLGASNAAIAVVAGVVPGGLLIGSAWWAALRPLVPAT